MRRNLFAIALVATLATVTADAFAAVGDDFFTPDMTAAHFAEALDAEAQATGSQPGALMFSADAVDVENVAADGTGVYVAVLDTGLNAYWPFFFSQANIAWWLGKGFSHDIEWDWGVGDIAIGPLRDDRGFITGYASSHGTHVTSTVAGFNLNGTWIRGIAQKATIIPVLVLDAWVVDTPFGEIRLSGGTDAMIAAGIYYVADLADTLDGRVVINMSLGGPGRSATIEAAVDYAIEKGVIVVASAGNEGQVGMGYPGGLEQIISAGAAGWASMFLYGWLGDVPENLNREDEIGNAAQMYLEDFSSRPNKDLDQKHQDLDISAPGAWIVGPYQPEFSDFSELSYYYLNGTSMASPHVAGIAALVLQAFPEVTQAEMEAILENAAAGTPLPASDAVVPFPFEDPYYYTTSWDGGDYGKGFVRADAALKSAGQKVR